MALVACKNTVVGGRRFTGPLILEYIKLVILPTISTLVGYFGQGLEPRNRVESHKGLHMGRLRPHSQILHYGGSENGTS